MYSGSIASGRLLPEATAGSTTTTTSLSSTVKAKSSEATATGLLKTDVLFITAGMLISVSESTSPVDCNGDTTAKHGPTRHGFRVGVKIVGAAGVNSCETSTPGRLDVVAIICTPII